MWHVSKNIPNDIHIPTKIQNTSGLAKTHKLT